MRTLAAWHEAVAGLCFLAVLSVGAACVTGDKLTLPGTEPGGPVHLAVSAATDSTLLVRFSWSDTTGSEEFEWQVRGSVNQLPPDSLLASARTTMISAAAEVLRAVALDTLYLQARVHVWRWGAWASSPIKGVVLGGPGAPIVVIDTVYQSGDTVTPPPPPPPPPPTDTLLLFADDFEDGNADGWSGALGTWAVVGGAYEQSNSTGDSWTWAGDPAWTDYALEARVQPRAWNGQNRLARVFARWQGASTWYAVNLRASGVLQIRENVGGTFTTLAEIAYPVALGTWYRLRFEVQGAALRLYVDDTLRLSAVDASLAAGQIALGGYYAAAAFDDVTVRRLLASLLALPPDTLAVDSTTLEPAWSSVPTSFDTVRLARRYWAGDAPMLCFAVLLVPADSADATATRLGAVRREKCPNGREVDPSFLLVDGRVWAWEDLFRTTMVTVR